jgi:hypothetical protein
VNADESISQLHLIGVHRWDHQSIRLDLIQSPSSSPDQSEDVTFCWSMEWREHQNMEEKSFWLWFIRVGEIAVGCLGTDDDCCSVSICRFSPSVYLTYEVHTTSWPSQLSIVLREVRRSLQSWNQHASIHLNSMPGNGDQDHLTSRVWLMCHLQIFNDAKGDRRSEQVIMLSIVKLLLCLLCLYRRQIFWVGTKSATMQDQSQGRTRRVFRLVRTLRRVKILRPVLLYYEV